MKRFTNTELADMDLIYLLTDGNARSAEIFYREMYPQKDQSNRLKYANLYLSMWDVDHYQGKRGERPLTNFRCPPSKLGWKRTKSTVTCLMLKATADDRRHLALCHDEFRWPRYGLCRPGGISNHNYLTREEARTL
ncbi:hypothetical protein TNCV_4076931 [Trichonephila clavipes]|nr:hypothetical protein TNCV_4076931 [Trichonephila clavipes]